MTHSRKLTQNWLFACLIAAAGLALGISMLLFATKMGEGRGTSLSRLKALVGRFFPDAVKVRWIPLTLPNENEIEKITVKSLVTEQYAGQHPIPEFDVPPEYFEPILHALSPVESSQIPHDTHNGILPCFAAITIQTKTGKTIRIELIDNGKSVAMFTVDGISCGRPGKHYPVCITKGRYGDRKIDSAESILIFEILAEIYKEQQTHAKSNELPELIDRLKRSKGELPPIQEEAGKIAGISDDPVR
jgi:hypothetical protein